jgi:hypothetical protein
MSENRNIRDHLFENESQENIRLLRLKAQRLKEASRLMKNEIDEHLSLLQTAVKN